MPGEALVGIVQPSLAIVRGNPANSSRSLRMNLSRKSRSSTRRLIKLSPRDAITRLPLIRAHEGGEDVRLYAVYHTDFFSFLSFFPRPILYIYILLLRRCYVTVKRFFTFSSFRRVGPPWWVEAHKGGAE